MASGSSSFMSPEPDPSRTVSFSRSSTSKRPLPMGWATTRWTELVPMSTAANGGPVASDRVANSVVTWQERRASAGPAGNLW